MSFKTLMAMVIAAGLGCSSALAAGAAPGPSVFVLGVWVQPIEMMDAWQARGINTMVEVPQGHEVDPWARAADAKGLMQIRQPAHDLAADIKDPHLLAWATNDEPSDKRGPFLDYGQVAQDPAAVVRQAAPWRAAARAAGRFVPIWTNHVGPHISPDWAQHNALMHDYMQGPASDWLAADSYPIQGRRPPVIRSNDGYTSTIQGIVLDRQRAWSGGKPIMTFIGTSAFNLGDPTPSVAEFNLMAWSSVIHGASGIIYFPVQFTPNWSFDVTPRELVQAITSFDRRIGAMNDILMDRRSGGRSPYTLFRSANPGERPGAGQLPYPFEATEIATPHGPFRIVLNLSQKSQALNRPEWGMNQVVLPSYSVWMSPTPVR